MKIPYLVPALCALCFGLSSCTSISVYQTGKTLPQGEAQIGVGLGAGKFKPKAGISGFKLDIPSISGDIWTRYGFSDRIDGGLKYSFLSSGTADLRYGIYNERNGDILSMATGVTYVYSQVTTSHNSYDDKTVIHDLGVPLYISKDLAKCFTVYTVPRYVRRQIRNKRTTATPLQEHIDADMVGMGGGIMINFGRHYRSHLAMEYHKLYEPADKKHYVENAGVALAFGF